MNGLALQVVNLSESSARTLSRAMQHDDSTTNKSSFEVTSQDRVLQSNTVVCTSEWFEGQHQLPFLLSLRKRYPTLPIIVVTEATTSWVDLLPHDALLQFLPANVDESECMRTLGRIRDHFVSMQAASELIPDLSQARARRWSRGIHALRGKWLEFVMTVVVVLLALQGLFLLIGTGVLVFLYLLKSLLGINLIADMHVYELWP